MKQRLEIRMFAHSWVSDWNHGNAHFLRGLARELLRLGHGVRCYEELGSWSLSNLVRQEGEVAIGAIDQFRRTFPELDIQFYRRGSGLREVMKHELRSADLVLIHEWNEPSVVSTILDLKRQLGFRALFHDTHHRAYTSPRDILRFDLHLFDGVLAFGEAMRRIYANGFGVPQVWTFHEGADVSSFHPVARPREIDILWIGNWGDAACFFRHNNAHSLTATVMRLHSDRRLQRKYANSAYEHARARFSADRMVDEYLTLYGTLVTAEAAAA
ncbi:MAG TPA: hypothetical protein VE734_08670 [Terriglobales bacterium]|nr:hypothetical protein [Terriglobales bacterium]